MLASGLPSSSGLVGRNLMDHAYLLNWALLPEIAGTYRGTNCTGGITDLRGGRFRRRQAAFAVDIHNDGWGWATGSPYTDLVAMVDDENLFGDGTAPGAAGPAQPAAAAGLHDRRAAQREQPGDRRPELHRPARQHAPGDLLHAARLHDARRRVRPPVRPPGLPAAGRRRPHPLRPATTRPTSPTRARATSSAAATTWPAPTSWARPRDDSVVNADQRSWDHDNLYLVGGGSMPAIGTSNVTLTLAALCFRTADHDR